MRQLLIIWHSRTGAAKAMAAAVAEGARAVTVEGDEPPVRLLEATLTQPEDLLAADAYVFVGPENLGALSGEMKALFDRSYYALLGQIEGRAYASVIAAGSAGQGAQAQLDRIVTGWRLRRVAAPIIINLAAQTPQDILAPKQVSLADLNMCHELGQSLAAGLDLGLF